MSLLLLGNELPDLGVKLYAGSAQSFGFGVTDRTGAPVDLTGAVPKITAGDFELIGAPQDSTFVWSLAGSDTADLEWVKRKAVLTVTQSGSTVTWAVGYVEIVRPEVS